MNTSESFRSYTSCYNRPGKLLIDAVLFLATRAMYESDHGHLMTGE